MSTTSLATPRIPPTNRRHRTRRSGGRLNYRRPGRASAADSAITYPLIRQSITTFRCAAQLPYSDADFGSFEDTVAVRDASCESRTFTSSAKC